jgi:hypothetical protein
MNDITQHIEVTFSVESDWEETHRKTTEAIISVGALFGDDPALMRAKAECVNQLLHAIVDKLPNVQFTTRLPGSLTAEQIEQLRPLFSQATVRGMEDTLNHCVHQMLERVLELCTSKLGFPRAGEQQH